MTVAVTEYRTGAYAASRPYTNYDKGTAVSKVAHDVLTTFDHNKDGVLDFNSWERFRLGVADGSTHGAVGVFSGERLLRAADGLGQRDGKITLAELTTLARRYDTGAFGGIGSRDGHLNGFEMLRALSEVGPQLVWFVGGQK